MIDIDKIYNEDCLEGMKRIPSGSVDAIICDLPYEVLNKGNKCAQWDVVIPFDKLWEQYERVMKKQWCYLFVLSGYVYGKADDQ